MLFSTYNRFARSDEFMKYKVDKDRIKKKIQEFYNEYKGCPCTSCRERYFCENKAIVVDLIERCKDLLKDDDEYDKIKREVVQFYEDYEIDDDDDDEDEKKNIREIVRLYYYE